VKIVDWPVVGAAAGVLALGGVAAVSVVLIAQSDPKPVRKTSQPVLALVEPKSAVEESTIFFWDGSTIGELKFFDFKTRRPPVPAGGGGGGAPGGGGQPSVLTLVEPKSAVEESTNFIWDGSTIGELKFFDFKTRRPPVPAGGGGGGAPGGGGQPSDLTSFVKKWEADPSTGRAYTQSYQDQGGLTIGYGTAGRPGEHINEEEANRRLDAALAQVRSVIEKMNPNLSDGSKKALTSLLFNLGGDVSKLRNHGMAQAIMANDTEAMKSAHLQFSHVGGPEGKVLPGLLQRRQEELKFYELR
jgi:GH24 family phage-related lysozyme (muramidase)